MSDILAKDRKPLSNRLYIDIEATNLLAKLLNIVNNPNLFPPEHRDTLGLTMINNCNTCVESINIANRTILSVDTYKVRRNISYKSYDACIALISNLNTYYIILNTPDMKKTFILELLEYTTKLSHDIDKWIKSDEKRYNCIVNEQAAIIAREKSKKNSERCERSLLSRRRETPGIIIPFYFVGENNTRLGDAANTNKQIKENAVALRTIWNNSVYKAKKA